MALRPDRRDHDRETCPRSGGTAQDRPPRRPRIDAGVNRDRLLAAAASAMTREGRHVPLAVIAADAGVGVGTLYRKYADRDALMQALEYRACGLLGRILDDISRRDLPGLEAIGEFLAGTVKIAGQLVLPLRGAPPMVTAEAVAARRGINSRLDAFIARGQADGGIGAPVNATDVIAFSALITQPLTRGPGWERLAATAGQPGGHRDGLQRTSPVGSRASAGPVPGQCRAGAPGSVPFLMRTKYSG